MYTAEMSFANPHATMRRYQRSVEPVMKRAIILGERLRNYQYELIDARGYVKLQNAVKAIEKFFESNGK